MAKVDIPVDLTSIKLAVMFGLTSKQLKYVVPAFIFSAITYWNIRETLGDVFSAVVFCLIMILISAPGFFDSEKGGLGLEISKRIRQAYYYKQVRYLKVRKEDNFVGKEKRKKELQKKK